MSCYQLDGGRKHPLKITKMSKDLSRFNVDDLLSLPQEIKTIIIDTLLNSGASSSSAPTAIYESAPYCISINFSDKDYYWGPNFIIPMYASGYI
ncbi:uncharacterized protein E5676_scaffold487G00160 [Cucumis melo var. makuwa]|uniref:Uncharacterized protein n=1 Tax=Cucumis melo var. makuwa TaxID=1194695 RepID=A0A5D3BFZ2_CUCMM|nr:uncharacterized protein E6C27_scaffold1166G00200 [Cucumis melo var. makuwa]TYJ97994.1 uncharacterized protein E5676_scaffold487G00160 [Cucumis melo var. makuwa]